MALDHDVRALVAAKAGRTVSVCLPARDEQDTVGAIVERVRRDLVDTGFVDEVVVIDDGSTDATGEVAAAAGARVVPVASVLPELPPGSGKGNALWASLYASEGDVVCWLDADVRHFRSHFVTRLVAPLLDDVTVGLVKGFYRRPLDGQPTGGGRVTELMARPVISALFPHLARFVQPLAGEYAGRRSVLETLPFVEGYGVEIGLLIDIVEQYGLGAVSQVDLGVREHRNRPLDELAPQAMAVLVTALRRAGIAVDSRVAALLRFDEDLSPERVAVEVRERPPMIKVASYRAKFGRELSA